MYVNVPENHEVLISIEHENTHSYQFVKIKDLNYVKSKFPNPAKILIFCRKIRFSRVHIWSTFSVEDKARVQLHRYISKVTDETLYLNAEWNHTTAIAFDREDIISNFTKKKSIVKNVAISNIAIGNKVEIKNAQLFINNIKIPRGFIKNFEREIKEYIKNRDLFPYDYSILEKLINDNMIVTLFFNKNVDFSDLIVDNKLKVPVSLNKLFYFLYGKSAEIISYGIVKGKRRKWGLIKGKLLTTNEIMRYRRKVYNSDGYTFRTNEGVPIFFVKGTPITLMERVGVIGSGKNTTCIRPR